MNKKKIIYSILKEIDRGEVEPKAIDYGLKPEDFGDILVMMQEELLIKGAIFSKQGNKVLLTFLNNTKLTMKGLEYLEENSTWNKSYKGLKGVKEWLKK